ncbi:MAG: FAD-dependent oxidoreductase [Actinomycetota bacterium]|nr:FAD-dependent oxidoreductase [Actinomycetota bacterium]
MLACEVPADAAARIARVDPLRPLARRAERLTPWFYEQRFGSPRFLRQPYLRVLRHLSSAPRLPADPISLRGLEGGALETEALVVGGGPAGLAAATALADRGLTVLLVERDRLLGGSSRWIPSAHREQGLLPEVTVLLGATCVGLYEEEALAGVVGPGGPRTVRFDRLVVATGAYDRPLAYAGNDLPGTIGLRAFERYAAAGSLSRGNRVGVVAAPREASRAVAAARAAGISLAFVAGPAEIPVEGQSAFPRHRIERVEGRGRVRSVRLEGGTPIPCDVLVMGFTQPSFELQGQAGARISVEGEPAVVAVSGETRFPLLAVGEAAGHLEPGTKAPAAIAAVERWLSGDDPAPVPPPDLPEASIRHPGAFACLCEDVRVSDLTEAIEDGFDSAELVKRRTGAGTGPCQGKLCLGEVAAILRAAGLPTDPPTIRPPARPVSIAALGGVADV